MTRAPRAAASSRVPSVECASTTTISSQKLTERRQASIRSASLKVIMQADKPLSLVTRTPPSPRAKPVEYSQNELGPVLRPGVPAALRHAHPAHLRPGRHRGDPDTGGRCAGGVRRSEEHTSELQSQSNLVCRLLLEKKKKNKRHSLNYTKNKNIQKQ